MQNTNVFAFFFFYLNLVFSISVSGSVLWRYKNSPRDKSFNVGNVFSWISLS